jgi:cytochrome c oxidase assembly factor CtaG
MTSPSRDHSPGQGRSASAPPSRVQRALTGGLPRAASRRGPWRTEARLPGRRSAALVAGRLLGVGAGLVAGLAAAPGALAHGEAVPTEPPDPVNLLTGWSGDWLVWLPALAALALWWIAVRRVNREHPAHPVPRVRTWSWVAGVAVVLVALDSGIGRYDTALFWIHMIQHMLLTLVAAPLLVYAGPITMLLRASSPETRRRRIFPVLHSRVARFLTFPVVSWLLLAVVMWASHFSPLFDAALEDEWIHRFEHAMFLSAALLFWWPVVGPDPTPWRMSPVVKVLYVGLQMPQNTFLALAIYISGVPLYQHYATTVRAWGPTALEDQQMAGGVMWIGGDLIFLTILFLLVIAWMRDEERRMVVEDRRLDAGESATRERAARLAARRAAEAAWPPGELPEG